MQASLRFAPLALALGVVVLAGKVPAAAENACSGDSYRATRAAEITLTAADFFDPYGLEMRTFVETGSLGRVEVEIVSARPHDIVRSISASPGVSRLSPYFGEHLKGINVSVRLYRSRKSPVVRIRLQQACAKYLRDTFLYY